MGATIKDVAKCANVSVSTVSRVISNSDKISDETKLKVLKCIEKLNYHPNEIARSLMNNKSKIILLILSNLASDVFKNHFFIKLMEGISLEAQKKDYNIMYSFAATEDEELKLIEKHTNSKLIDGVILSAVRKDDNCIQYLLNKKFPFVVIGRPETSQDVLWVNNDNFKAMYDVVNILIRKGLKNIGFIGGPRTFSMGEDRFLGYIQALKINGIVIDENIIYHGEDYTEDFGYSFMREIIEYKYVDAIVTTDDLLAFGASKFMKEKKIKNIVVVGFNNNPIGDFVSPAICTVDINANALGKNAIDILVDRLEGKEMVSNHVIVDTSFIYRE